MASSISFPLKSLHIPGLLMNTLAKLNYKSIKVIALNWKNYGQNSPFKEFIIQTLELHSCMSTQSAREHSKRHAQETTTTKALRCMASCVFVLLNIKSLPFN